MDSLSLKNKTAIVTGSSRGIGRAIAIAYARAGARVVITSRKADACAAVVEQIRSEGLEATAIACNISRKDEVLGLVEQTEKVYGTVDVLVCNAAVNPYYGPMSGITDEAFSKVMDVNIRSNLWLVNRTAPGMAAKGGGAVVIISSIAGLTGSRVLGAYGISKAADMSLARSLALEWGKQGIRINCIAPGLIKTDFAKALWDNPETLANALKSSPLNMIGEPEDIAGAALLLGSHAGRFITGTTIVIDGGATIGGGDEG
ncbi:7-alpha-hydroxysteroid dehydrogenase [Xylophilus ampelinus]|nr:SDR family oxidoreductase [Variovorax sp.]VTY34604.1 7-alpha-hydroxysteroid dehydrogenase [Xylophilus ampelinus]